MTWRYRFISEHRTTYAVAVLCRVLGVRRPGFYEWLDGEPARAQRAAAEEELATEIAAVHAEHRSAYGCPRVTAELRRRGRVINRKRVERLMRQREIVGLTRRRRRSLTKQDTTAAPAPDLIGRDFIVGWVRLAGRAITPGTHPVDSVAGWAAWLVHDLMDLARNTLFPFYASVFAPIWLRLLGAL